MNIFIGNIISLTAAGFMISSGVMKDRNRLFLFQTINALLLILASLFFKSYAGIAALTATAVRNYAIYKDVYNKKVMTVCFVFTVLFGLLFNNRGLLGILPIIATGEYTVCSYYFKSIKETKISLIINLSLWVIYSFCIFDFSTALTDFMTVVLSFAWLIKEES